MAPLAKHELLHIVGGGIYLGSAVVSGGPFATARRGGPADGAIVIHVHADEFAPIGEAIAKLPDLGALGPSVAFDKRNTGGYSARQRREAWKTLRAGGRISINNSDRGAVWVGTLADLGV